MEIKITNKQKFILVLIFLSLVSSHFFYKSITSKSLKGENKKLEEEYRKKVKSKENHKKMLETLEEVKKRYPKNSIEVEVLTSLEFVEDKLGDLELIELVPKLENIKTENHVSYAEVNVLAEGEYGQFTDFLLDIETQKKSINVESIELNYKEDKNLEGKIVLRVAGIPKFSNADINQPEMPESIENEKDPFGIYVEIEEEIEETRENQANIEQNGLDFNENNIDSNLDFDGFEGQESADDLEESEVEKIYPLKENNEIIKNYNKGVFYGIEIKGEYGENVQSIVDGQIIHVGQMPGYENVLIIQDGNQKYMYGYLNEVFVEKGDIVYKEKPVGKLGFENKLYFAVIKDNVFINPEEFLGQPKEDEKEDEISATSKDNKTRITFDVE